jgi:hypothetical protein
MQFSTDLIGESTLKQNEKLSILCALLFINFEQKKPSELIVVVITNSVELNVFSSLTDLYKTKKIHT